MSQIQAIWSEVDFDDKEMKSARGSLPKMINLIQQKTGESREQILKKMGTIL
ncbi:MAG TPA: general stress protein CsbD [Rhodothermales bacterium]